MPGWTSVALRGLSKMPVLMARSSNMRRAGFTGTNTSAPSRFMGRCWTGHSGRPFPAWLPDERRDSDRRWTLPRPIFRAWGHHLGARYQRRVHPGRLLPGLAEALVSLASGVPHRRSVGNRGRRGGLLRARLHVADARFIRRSGRRADNALQILPTPDWQTEAHGPWPAGAPRKASSSGSYPNREAPPQTMRSLTSSSRRGPA